MERKGRLKRRELFNAWKLTWIKKRERGKEKEARKRLGREERSVERKGRSRRRELFNARKLTGTERRERGGGKEVKKKTVKGREGTG